MPDNVSRSHPPDWLPCWGRWRYRCPGQYALRIFPALGCYSVACSGGGLTGLAHPWQGYAALPFLAGCIVQLADARTVGGRLTECDRVTTLDRASTERGLPSGYAVTQDHHGNRSGPVPVATPVTGAPLSAVKMLRVAQGDESATQRNGPTDERVRHAPGLTGESPAVPSRRIVRVGVVRGEGCALTDDHGHSQDLKGVGPIDRPPMIRLGAKPAGGEGEGHPPPEY